VFVTWITNILARAVRVARVVRVVRVTRVVRIVKVMRILAGIARAKAEVAVGEVRWRTLLRC
jgi:hypothetical protein